MSGRHQRERGTFVEQQRQRDTAAGQRTRQTMRDLHAVAAKTRGKTQKATAKRQGRG
ncbi:hypothetical protein [Streptomyces sparsus]